MAGGLQRLISGALAALGVENLVLGIQAPSFPGLPDEDVGRGSPSSQGAAELLGFARALGFGGVQLGPEGQVAYDNPSPYDGSQFSRTVLNVSLPSLASDRWGRPLSPERIRALVLRRPPGSELRAAHRYAFRCLHLSLADAFDVLKRRAGGGDAQAREGMAELDAFIAANEAWLEPDALYEGLRLEHRDAYWRHWPESLDKRLFAPRPGEEERALERRRELRGKYAPLFGRYAFGQMVAHAQHLELRERAAAFGLKLYGDLQIGRAPKDAWRQQGLFLPGYRMGAPPSRTNPEGQDWAYEVLDPRKYRGGGAALRLMRARMDKLFAEFDGVRIDHPHGLVCPWVYRQADGDRLAAVRAGARLFESPDLPDHPELQQLAIARPDQLDRSRPRFADGWVSSLDDDQVRRYAVLFEAVVCAAAANRRRLGDLVCEVLSTLPYPLGRVLDLYRLGRFRVTQKVGLDDTRDVYRSENAEPVDWNMMGNHDTLPIWAVVRDWEAKGKIAAHARYLAERLCPGDADRARFAEEIAKNPNRMAQAKAAELFASKARNVMVFFTDLLGMTEPFNRPGIQSEDNWNLRVPRTYRMDYAARLAEGAAMNVPLALATALRAKGGPAELISALEDAARTPPG